MKNRILRTIHRNQKGLTFVELMIAMALFGIVAGAITMTFTDVFAASVRTSRHMTAIRQVQSAGYWVSHDALQARHVLLDNQSDFHLTLEIPYRVGEGVDSEEKTREVVYEVVGGNLHRTIHYEESPGVTAIVAEHIVGLDFGEDDDQAGVYILRVTAAANGGPSVEREYRIEPRPGT